MPETPKPKPSDTARALLDQVLTADRDDEVLAGYRTEVVDQVVDACGPVVVFRLVGLIGLSADSVPADGLARSVTAERFGVRPGGDRR